MDIQKKIDRIDAMFQHSELTTKRSDWQEISEYAMPGYQDFTTSSPYDTDIKRNIDNSPAMYNKELATTIFNGLVSPGTRWFQFKFKEAQESHDANIELHGMGDVVLEEFVKPASSFSSQMFSVLESCTAFGPGVMGIDYSTSKGMIFKAIPISQVAMAENYEGDIDTVVRKFKYTARQIKQRWPEFSDHKFESLLNASPDSEVEVYHAVWNKEGTKKYEYCYILPEYKAEVEQYVENHLDFQVLRWAKHAGETYGHGQGKIALGFMEATTGARAETGNMIRWSGRPAILTSDEMRALNNLKSGTQTNPVKPGVIIPGGLVDNQPQVQLMSPAGDISASSAFYQVEQDNLKRAFFIDKIQLPQDSTRRTAFEVAAMQREEVKYLAPFISNLEMGLKSIVNTVTKIMSERGKLKDFDIDLKDIEVEFLSPLARQLKMEDARALNTFLQMALGFINISPQDVASIDVPQCLRILQEATGTPLAAMRSDEKVQEILQAQQEAANIQKQQAQSEIAKNSSEAFKNTQV